MGGVLAGYACPDTPQFSLELHNSLKDNPAGETTGSKASFTLIEYVPPGGIIPFALITVAAPAQATLPWVTGGSPYCSGVHSKPAVGRGFHQLPLSVPML